jgi:Tol biopolymer transport system component
VSVASDGAQANRSAWEPAISADGRFVAFRSSATNLVPGDTNDMGDVFLHDRATGETTRVSVASDATQGDSGSGTPAISADGRFVAFHSSAATLVSDDTNLGLDVFVHDRVTGETTRVSVSSDGQQADEAAWVPSISADGRHISFQSRARTLVGDTDAGSTSDVFVHDRITRRTRLASVTSDGVQANGDSSTSSAAMSAVGDRITFSSGATNLWPSDPGWPPSLATAVFLHTPAAA